MPVVHYRPRVPAAAAVVPPATTKVVVPTRPTTPLPATTVRTSTSVVVSTARATATTKVVVPPTTTRIIATTPTVARTTTQPLTTSSSLISSSTTPLITSTTTTPRTTPTKTTAVKPTSVAFFSSPVTASASPSASPTSGASGGSVAAGIIGGLVGIMLTGLVVAFFFRRWHRKRSRSHDSMNFDVKNFRRSAIMLESSPPLQPPNFSSNTSVRSVPIVMDYRQHQTSMVAHHQYPYMHAQVMHSPYTPDTPSYGSSPEYHIPQNPFYVPPGQQQGYPPEMHRQGSGGHPSVAPPHYHYENHEDAYGGM